ncbi:tyrosine-type recombinase/integrase [Amycolatopsis sp. DG1A-15b]|uniref:tyrosine-type recombinase/integrase n=1 Tax=Amycolatopsis sp. DG1A-15b TaxID=3052846 RepID=UPI00255B9B5C|nr:tyrosine-type recombinase/integrase [Amycolatopsis sp. DG1A-15b]WIX92703.1 tyrosine-type recombinase/integrase [Amycolatopsis sp. DG1A-15b]
MQDRWWRQKKDAEGKPVFNAKGHPVREKTELFGKGDRYKVRYYDPEGNERSKSFPDKQLTKAKTFLTKMQHDVLAGEYISAESGEEKFRDYTAQWRKGQSADAGTRQTVSNHLKTGIFPFLGDKPLKVAAKTDTIRDWLDWLERPKSEGGRGLMASTRAVLFDTVSAILQAAYDDKKIRTNPCRAKSVKRPKPVQRKVIPWPDSRVRAVRLALPAEYTVTVPLGAGLGLRQMEIFGFSPDDIDRDEMIVNVQRQIRWIGTQPVFSPPKGGKTRVVPLGQGVLDDIDDYMATFEPVTLTLPWLEPGGRPETVRVLIGRVIKRSAYAGQPIGNVIKGSNFAYHAWRPAFARAGLDYVERRDGMHAMRHFFASTMLANGVSIKEVAEYLGHHDPGYTLRIYTHLVPSSHKRARAATNRVFKPRRPQQTDQDSVTA